MSIEKDSPNGIEFFSSSKNAINLEESLVILSLLNEMPEMEKITLPSMSFFIAASDKGTDSRSSFEGSSEL